MLAGTTENGADSASGRATPDLLGTAGPGVGCGSSNGDEAGSTGSESDGWPLEAELTTEPELRDAIEECKDAILEAETSSAQRRHLVVRLVELRLRLMRLLDGTDKIPEGAVRTGGHLLQPQRLSRRRAYCHHCSGIILALLHLWYTCQHCQLRVHANCLSQLRRRCALDLAKQWPQYERRICPERGLSSQRFSCADCDKVLNLEAFAHHGSFVHPAHNRLEPLLCDYNGKYYCTSCHWNDRAVIPARVLHNWDFSTYPVSCVTHQYLQVMYQRPVLDLETLNPHLFNFVEELRHIKKLRDEIMMMKEYFLTCRAALESRILLSFGDRQYMVETSRMYSLRDLVETQTGELLVFLLGLHAKFSRHIREECAACIGKGHLCQVCGADQVLFPFDALVVPCPQCARLMHQHCYVRRDGQCVGCARRGQRAKLQALNR